jgi:predicted esterase
MSISEDLPHPVWESAEVTSPHLQQHVPVVAARDIPYIVNANRLQNLSIYLPRTSDTEDLIGTPADALPGAEPQAGLPRYHVHIHGGAWRDPQLTSQSIEPTVAHAFSTPDTAALLSGIVSINYTVSKFPTHPTLPYDPIKDNHTDPAREAVHPQHVSDALHGLALLRELGLTASSYILSGHSCGACIAFEATLQSPHHYGLDYLPEPPAPAALLGLNGLYDLQELVTGLGDSHAHLRDDYEMFISNAFGADKATWPAASPARFEAGVIAERVEACKAPPLVVLDQSTEDQLVPLNQTERLETTLGQVAGLRVIRGHRCTGKHAAPWEQGTIIWESIQDILHLLRAAT